MTCPGPVILGAGETAGQMKEGVISHLVEVGAEKRSSLYSRAV